jgi:hypothetical protein
MKKLINKFLYNLSNWKFCVLILRLYWLRLEFEAQTNFQPKRLYLRDDIFEFLYHRAFMRIPRGFEFGTMEEYVGVKYLRRDNGIKFARYE